MTSLMTSPLVPNRRHLCQRVCHQEEGRWKLPGTRRRCRCSSGWTTQAMAGSEGLMQWFERSWDDVLEQLGWQQAGGSAWVKASLSSAALLLLHPTAPWPPFEGKRRRRRVGRRATAWKGSRRESACCVLKLLPLLLLLDQHKTGIAVPLHCLLLLLQHGLWLTHSPRKQQQQHEPPGRTCQSLPSAPLFASHCPQHQHPGAAAAVAVSPGPPSPLSSFSWAIAF